MPSHHNIAQCQDVVVGNANQAIGGVVTAVFEFECFGLILTIVAEDDVAWHVERVAVGPAVNEVAAWGSAHNFYQRLSGPAVLTKGLGATVNPCVRRAKTVVLEVAVQLATRQGGSTRWDGGLRLGSYFALLGFLNFG